MVCTGSEWVGPRHQRGTAVEHYAGIDVSLERSSVCVVDATGRIVREAKVASEPEAPADFFRPPGLPLARRGLEAAPPSQWLHAALAAAWPVRVVGFPRGDWQAGRLGGARVSGVGLFVALPGPAAHPAARHRGIERGAPGLQTDGRAGLVALLRAREVHR